MPALQLQVFLDDPDVTDVRLQRHVEQVAEHRHGAADHLDGNVACHPGQLVPWQAERVRLLE